jgi:hypothetical protein
MEGLLWLFRTAESLNYDFRTILHFAVVMISTQPSPALNMTKKVIMMWICAWTMMWKHWTALIYNAM